MSDGNLAGAIDRAAAAIAGAEALLITAGAGIGVDSGLPDFRGPGGFWQAYPRLGALAISFEEMARPSWFRHDPAFAWAFYGHRQMLYRATKPHRGFALLKRWADGMRCGHFVFTSNVDGQFQVAGFAGERVVECHGSIHRLQCSIPCTAATWISDESSFDIDAATFRVRGALPRCPACGGIARPNVLMFGDGAWVDAPTSAVERRYSRWLAQIRERRVVVIECGAGVHIPTVRRESERTAERFRGPLIRINPGAPEGPPYAISIALPAQAALERIAEAYP